MVTQNSASDWTGKFCDNYKFFHMWPGSVPKFENHVPKKSGNEDHEYLDIMAIFQDNGMIGDVHLGETLNFNSKDVLVLRHTYNKEKHFERVLVFQQL